MGRLINDYRWGRRSRKFHKKTGNKGRNLRVADLRYQANSLEFAQLVTVELLEPRNVFSGFSSSSADSTLELSKLLSFFFFLLLFLSFPCLFNSTGTSSHQCHFARDFQYVRQVEKPKWIQEACYKHWFLWCLSLLTKLEVVKLGQRQLTGNSAWTNSSSEMTRAL